MKINDNNAFLMASGTGSSIEIHTADAKKDSWTQIVLTAEAGDTTLQLAKATGWNIGDKIAIASTGYDMEEAEERTIIAVSDDGLTITLDRPLEHRHYGEVETYKNGLNGDDYREWDLDMRAEVALLSRNVTIQGDADAPEDGYGGHTMIMNGATMHLDGVELTKMGQIGEVGRYPLHWHMLGDASGQYVTNSSVHETYNKGLTIHGTQNTWVEDVAIYNTIGHTYYLEDGSEFGNMLLNTLGMNTYASESLEAATIGTDFTEVSTYWITNPDNHLIGNHSAGSADTGFWILSQDHVEGISAQFDIYASYSPSEQTPGEWAGNTAHSNKEDAFFIGQQFDESTGLKVGPDPKLTQQYRLDDFTAYKNEGFGLWVRHADGTLTDLKLEGHNKGAQFWGSSIIEDSLIVGASGNFEERPHGEFHGVEFYDDPVHLDGVHFEGFDGATDAAMAQGNGRGKSSNNTLENVTFGDSVPDGNQFRTKNKDNEFQGRNDGAGTVVGALHDLDASLTGTAGQIITPGIVEVRIDDKIDILNYAYQGIAGSGFNASEGAVWNADWEAWINPVGSVIGKVEYYESNDPAEREEFIITRLDNSASLLVGQETSGEGRRIQLNVDGSGEVTYEIAYVDALPDLIDMDFIHLPEGATAIYRFKGLPEDVKVQGATALSSLQEIQSVQETAWFQDTNGDIVVRIYADRFDGGESTRADVPIAWSETFTDKFKIIIESRATDSHTGNFWPEAQLEQSEYWKETSINPAPLSRPDSTSKTVAISDDDDRWSDAATWGGKTPNHEDIIVIGPDQSVVLDTSVWVKAILVNGGTLVAEDRADIRLAADWILVTNGGTFQVGSEDNPFKHEFELTLEGDDPDNDVDVMALIDPNAVDVVRALPVDPEAAPETTQNTVIDTEDAKSWSYYTDTIDGDGARSFRAVVNDNGSILETGFRNRLKTEERLTDVGGQLSWDTQVSSFENGVITSKTVGYDDGRINETHFVDGVRSSLISKDLGDVKIWSEINYSYDGSGQIVSKDVDYDDGRLATNSYENGKISLSFVADAANAFKWDTLQTVYDDMGQRVEVTQIFDDGRLQITDYTNGVRSSMTLTDETNVRSWLHIVTQFDADGQRASREVTYDTGRIITDTFDDGSRTSRLTEDINEVNVFATQLVTYAPNGARV